MKRRLPRDVSPVFVYSVVLATAFVGWGLASPESMATTTSAALEFFSVRFGWFYLISVFGFLAYAIYLALGPYAHIKLGQPDEEPDYPYFTWFAMLFSAGMGIGLVFWGVAEPISHFAKPPPFIDAGDPAAAARGALRMAYFHWGLHAWAIYTLIGIALAYVQFRKRRPGLISEAFRPLLHDRTDSWIGHSINTLATLATVFGVATSLGFGTLQVNGGLAAVFNVPVGLIPQLVIIAVVSVLYMTSATTGLDRGIRYLSNLNMTVAAGLLLFVLLLGPTSFLIDAFITTLGSYVSNIVSMSLRLAPFSGSTWGREWTIFYWAWWISWAPFVGMFIARVSRGRTIREFVGGVLLVPALLGALWFAVFGGAALHQEMFGAGGLVAAVDHDVSSALFAMLGHLPAATLTSALATLLIITFFITSADSATFVLGMQTWGGSLHPPNRIKLVWGVLQSSIAAVLIISGGLTGLQTTAILTALPFTLIMIGMCVALQKALGGELRIMRQREKDRTRAIEALLVAHQTAPKRRRRRGRSRSADDDPSSAGD